MNQHSPKPIRRRIAAVLIALTALLAVTASPASSEALNPQEVYINPGGGAEADASDGLVIAFNRINEVELFEGGEDVDEGSDDVGYASSTQYCCGGSGPKLNIGGKLYGATDPVDFDDDPEDASPAAISIDDISLSIESMTGTASNTRTNDVGSGSVVLRYAIDHNGLDYEMVRTVTYVYPNTFFLDEYEIIIPEGNTEEVKFYLGGDTAPGSSDEGVGVETTEPVRSIYSVNPDTDVQFGYSEVAGSAPFDGALIGHYSDPYDTVRAGGDIGFNIVTEEHDAGIMIQWNIGTTAGSYDRALRHHVGARGASVTASFANAEIEPGGTTELVFEVLNTGGDEVEFEFDVDLPEGLMIAGPLGSGCNFPSTADGNDVAVHGVIESGNCFVTIPVTAETPGDYVIDSSSITDVVAVANTIAVTTLTVNGGPESECDRALTGIYANTQGVSGYLSRLYMATYLRQPDSAGHAYWEQELLNGDTLSHVTRFFIESPEFTERYSSDLATGEFVELLYNNVMCRPSDGPGFEFWRTALDDGEWTRTGMLQFWTDSAEFKTRSQEGQYPA